MAVFSYALGQPFPPACQGGAITIGNFDGVHRGHQALLAETARQAREVGGPAVAVTFDPPPSKVLRPDAFLPLLTPLPYRYELLQRQVDHVVVLQTTLDLLHLDPVAFFEHILHGGLRARAVIEGYNFGFGRGRAGTVAMLRELGHKAAMNVVLLEALQFEGRPVSSSRVRLDLAAGNVGHARAMLDRPYRLFGTVTRGQQRGHKLGFPTANLTELPNLVPGHGVYAVHVGYGEKLHDGAAHIGPNITFGVTAPSVEVHLLDFSGDLYGQALFVDFVQKVRDTRAFAGPEDLVRQIQADVAQVRRIL